MNLKSTVLSVGLGLTVSAGAAMASAAEKGPSDYLAVAWNHTYYLPFTSELADIGHVQASSSADQEKCDNFYSKVRRTGEMKILLGVGYYDFSEGEPFKFTYRPDGSFDTIDYDFGMNATLDQTIIKVYHELLTTKCHGALQFCGFEEESEGVYAKTVKAPDGSSIKAIIEMRSPSVTSSHAKNVGPLKSQQDSASKDVTDWFFGGIANADFVVYNGHARKGGGPDFNPPRLLSNNHVNYAWYGAHTPGLNNLLNALKNSETKPVGLMLMACNSTKLFEKQVEKVAPKIAYSGMNLVPVTGLVPAKGTIAGIDSFLKMQCSSGMKQELSVDSDMREQLQPLSMK